MSSRIPQSLEHFETQIAAAYRRAMEKTRKTPLLFSGAIVPFKSPIDKAAAFAAMSMHCEEEPVWLHVCKTTAFPDKKIVEWEKIGICCIDLGRRKYHHASEGSATEWVVQHYRLHRTVGLQKLVEVINKNNKTGYLKSFRHAVPHIMRELYELEPSDADWWSVHVLAEAAKVVTAFVRVENAGKVEREQMSDAIAQLVVQFGDADKPLTLGQYVSHLWTLGETPEAILEKLEFWQTGLKRLTEARKCAETQVAQAVEKGELLTFHAGRFPGVLLENRGHFFTKKVLKTHKFAIRVIVDADGHVTISTNGLDCNALAKVLEQREPGKWHHNAQMGALLNGGPMYPGNPVTQIPVRTLIEFVKSFVTQHKPKKQ